MKKRTRILILGVAMMLIMAMSGCGVNHKSPEGVVEALIKNYVSGSEKKVKQCYSQEKDTNELLQNEIDATLKYFAAHNPTKVKVEQCDILSENGWPPCCRPGSAGCRRPRRRTPRGSWSR